MIDDKEKFNIDNQEKFSIEFLGLIRKYSTNSFHEINKSILHDPTKYYKNNFTEKEIAGIISLNKYFFQNVESFIILSELKLYIPSFNCLRAAIEIMRIFRLYFLDNDFRKEYIGNANVNFEEVPDYKFMQSKVLKKLRTNKELLHNTIDDEEIIEYLYDEFLESSSISRLHSELSKWSHVLNINLLIPIQLDYGKIYLGLNNEKTDFSKSYMSKYIEGLYIILNAHIMIFPKYTFTKQNLSYGRACDDKYSEYIKLFY